VKHINRLVITGALLLAFALAGCASSKNTPSPAETAVKTKLSATINHSFDITWNTLIDYTLSSVFTIVNFNKSAGVITLSFGDSNAAAYINCGPFNATSAGVNYSGPYSSFLEQHAGAKLQGKMKVFVTELGPKQTLVKVNAQYLFNAPLTTPAEWAFHSGFSATVALTKEQKAAGGPQTRTCQPTYKAENAIMQAIKPLY